MRSGSRSGQEQSPCLEKTVVLLATERLVGDLISLSLSLSFFENSNKTGKWWINRWWIFSLVMAACSALGQDLSADMDEGITQRGTSNTER